MTSAERVELIDRYKKGYAEVTTALAGIAPEELDWKPAKSEWSAREVVHHLADSEMIAAVRLHRMLIADDAQLWRYDPDELAVRFTYAERPLEAAMALFQGVRAYTAELLDRMTEADWAKAGMPTPTGEYSTARWLQSYGPHAHDTPSRSGTTETLSGGGERAPSPGSAGPAIRDWTLPPDEYSGTPDLFAI
jgi:DinB superfamily